MSYWYISKNHANRHLYYFVIECVKRGLPYTSLSTLFGELMNMHALKNSEKFPIRNFAVYSKHSIRGAQVNTF